MDGVVDDKRRLWEALLSTDIYTLSVLPVHGYPVKLLFPSPRVLRRWRSKRSILKDDRGYVVVLVLLFQNRSRKTAQPESMIQILAAALVLRLTFVTWRKASNCGCDVQCDLNMVQVDNHHSRFCMFSSIVFSRCIHVHVTIYPHM